LVSSAGRPASDQQVPRLDVIANAVLRAIAHLVALLPERALGPLGHAVGWLVGSLFRIRRREVDAAIARAAIPGSRSSGVARAVYDNLGIGLLELLAIAGGRDRTLTAAAVIDPDATEGLAGAIARGPVVLCASHTGNWELAASAAARWLRAHRRSLIVVAKPMKNRGVDRFLAALRARLGILTLPPGGAFAAAGRALGEGDVVAMPIDQVPDRPDHGVLCTFLGRPALVDRAPATLAWRMGATLLVVAAERDAGGHHRVHLLDRIVPPPRGEGEARVWIREASARATEALDRFVRDSPASWFWLHRRWRQGGRPSVSGRAGSARRRRPVVASA
jgi:Kdo2-lipid IVA lauroyltransferase/acyltransferase